MDIDEVKKRIDRVQAAIGSWEESDLGKFKPTVTEPGHGFSIAWDGKAVQDEAELYNLAYSLISVIANLRDQLRGFARKVGCDPEDVNRTIATSDNLKILIDVYNTEKHGGPTRNPTRETLTGKNLRLNNVRRIVVLSVGVAGSVASVELTPKGLVARNKGDGRSSFNIDGDILDENDKIVKRLALVVPAALEDLEPLLAKWGLR